MKWSPRVKPVKIRRLYRAARLGLHDDDLLQTVGWELYGRCADIAAVADVYRDGLVPCPQCRTKVKRGIDPLFQSSDGGTHENWFHCPHCTQRLLWRDCRESLRESPRCFDCNALLAGIEELECRCGKVWDRKAYHRSVRTRVRLPCPHCGVMIRKPVLERTGQSVRHKRSRSEIECPKCQAVALHVRGYIECTSCGYKRRWRDYRKSLKKRDEKLDCASCGHSFRWQSWRKGARSLRTGNPKPARDFVEQWPKCRTPKARMIQIDRLLQALHGRGSLAPLFIVGDARNIREMLDEFASQV